MTTSQDEGVLRSVDIVLSQYEVCCYALVVSLTAISLCVPPRAKANESQGRSQQKPRSGLQKAKARAAKSQGKPTKANESQPSFQTWLGPAAAVLFHMRSMTFVDQ